MVTSDKVNSTLPEKGSIRTKKCKDCGAEKEQIWKPEEKKFIPSLKREMISEWGGWKWVHSNDALYDSNDLVADEGVCLACRAERAKRREAERLKVEETASRIERIEAVGGKLNYEKFTFDKYDPLSPSQAEAFKACKDFDPSRDNILLMGEAGVGKTHLAVATLNANYKEGSKRYRITELLRLFRFKRSADEEQTLIDEFAEAPILVIEDFGVQKTTDWSVQIFWEIIDRRIEAGRNGLVVTTNDGRSKIAEKMGDKISSRMSGICRVIKVEGLDLRVTTKPKSDK